MWQPIYRGRGTTSRRTDMRLSFHSHIILVENKNIVLSIEFAEMNIHC